MKKLILILLLFPFIFAGTWSHRVVKTLRHNATLVEFTRSPTGDVVNCTFADSPIWLTDRIALKKWNLEARWSVLNNFDLGDEGGESKEILWKLVKAIRNNPSLTITQATNWYDTNYPDGLYNGTQLLLRMRRWIEKETGYVPTWDQFKSYVIANKFGEVDSYVP